MSHTPAQVAQVADVNTATSHGAVGPGEVGPVELVGQPCADVGRRRRPPAALQDDRHGHATATSTTASSEPFHAPMFAPVDHHRPRPAAAGIAGWPRRRRPSA